MPLPSPPALAAAAWPVAAWPVAAWPVAAWALALAAARTAPLVWLVPALGGWRLSSPMRVALGGMLALLCVPMVAAGLGADLAHLVLGATANANGTAHAPIASAIASASAGDGAASRLTPTLALWLVRELAVGASIGVTAGAMFRAAELAGLVSGIVALSAGAGADGGAGGGSAEGDAPAAARIGELYLLLGIVAFLELGGLTLLAEAVLRSYRLIPLGALAPAGDPLASLGRAGPEGFTLPLVRGLAELVVLTTARIFETALVLAAPAIVAACLVTLGWFFVARAVPGLGGLVASPPVRAWLGLGVLVLGLGVFELTRADGEGWSGAMSQLPALVGSAIDLWRARRP
jgi:type III secretory pathway component EscT